MSSSDKDNSLLPESKVNFIVNIRLERINKDSSLLPKSEEGFPVKIVLRYI